MFKHIEGHPHGYKFHIVKIALLAILLLATSVFIIFKTRNVIRQYGYIGRAPLSQYTVTISGEGKVSGTPDIAKVSLGVTSEAKTVKLAQDNNTRKMNAIIAAVKALGVSDKDIQTANYSIYPKYSYDRKSGTSSIVGYTVSQSIAIKVRKLDNVGSIISKAGELGANQVGGIQFTIDDTESLKEKAREAAIDNANKKAKVLFKKLGVKAGRIVSFDESAPGAYPVYAETYAKGIGGGAAAPTIEKGSLDITVNVNLTFEIK